MALKFQPGDEVQVFSWGKNRWVDATIISYVAYGVYKVSSPDIANWRGEITPMNFYTKNIRVIDKICDTEEKLSRLLAKIR